MRDILNKKFGISIEVIDFCEKVYNGIQPQISSIKKISRHNQIKVLSAFANNMISSYHMLGTNGYGYDDVGREVIDAIYAEVFESGFSQYCDVMVKSGTVPVVTFFGVVKS
jgi:cystathionine beta-lyase family protein involved in aluminum resistance